MKLVIQEIHVFLIVSSFIKSFVSHFVWLAEVSQVITANRELNLELFLLICQVKIVLTWRNKLVTLEQFSNN